MTIISSRFEIDIIYMDRGLFYYAISSSDISYSIISINNIFRFLLKT